MQRRLVPKGRVLQAGFNLNISFKNRLGRRWNVFLACHSLIPFENSLFSKIFSLIICVGNCSRSGCSAAVSWHVIVSLSPRIAKFPVKFPDTREFARRRVRSALRRQPGSPAPGDFALRNARNARQWRAFANWQPVSRLRIWPLPERNTR